MQNLFSHMPVIRRDVIKNKGTLLMKVVIAWILILTLFSCSATSLEQSSDGGQNKSDNGIENSIGEEKIISDKERQSTVAPSVITANDENVEKTSVVPDNNQIVISPSNKLKDGKSGEQPTKGSNVDGKIYVHFIDVGQGDSIYIKAPSCNVLIDGGNKDNTTLNYLKGQGVDELDLVISTHPHADHIGGLINVLSNIKVKEVMDPAAVHTSKTFEDYLTLIDEKDIVFTETNAGMSRDLGDGLKLEILAPSSVSDSNLNNVSIVSRLVFENISFLFAGDAETNILNKLAKDSIKSDVLKVAHHGSHNGMSQSFIKAVSPKAAVISVGKGNSYGHPHDDALGIINGAGTDIYRTDLHGNIVIESDGQVIDVNIKQPYQYVPAKVPEETPKPTPAPIATPTPEPTPKPTEQPADPVVKGKFIGSVESDKYHEPDCRYAKKILPQNEIWFNSVEEAAGANYKPCKVCNPN